MSKIRIIKTMVIEFLIIIILFSFSCGDSEGPEIDPEEKAFQEIKGLYDYFELNGNKICTIDDAISNMDEYYLLEQKCPYQAAFLQMEIKYKTFTHMRYSIIGELESKFTCNLSLDLEYGEFNTSNPEGASGRDCWRFSAKYEYNNGILTLVSGSEVYKYRKRY